MSIENASEDNATARALRSRIFYVIQVVLFVLSVASLIIIIVVEYVGNTGGACITFYQKITNDKKISSQKKVMHLKRLFKSFALMNF